ncbi:hypothetical protein JQR85_13750 [Stutzerimonas urumqiensis]|uniref:hypothetical protein n=1 Tax=Stutzerimonas urumqiensis TaxID=638269 RepID=UPI003DA22C77
MNSPVVVEREQIEAVRNTLANGGPAVSVLRWAETILAAQPAEAEGVAVVGYAVTWIRVGDTPEKTVFMSAADFEATGGPRFYSYREPLVLQSAHLAALSAVTAERDRLRGSVDMWSRRAINWAERNDELRAEVERMRARIASDEKKLDALLAHCPDGECAECSKIICEHGDPMHFHHDGCPSC